VTISSLRATMDDHSDESTKVFGLDLGQRSQARWSVYVFTTIFAAALILVVATNVFWIWGTSIATEIQKDKKELDDARQKIAERKPKSPRDTSGSRTVKVVDTPIDQELLDLESLRATLELQQESHLEMLRLWTELGIAKTKIWPKDLSLDGMCKKQSNAGQIKLCENVSRYQSVLVVLDVLQRYFLPLLYGFLGSCVYVLRTLSSEIRSRTYTQASNIGFRIRLALGMLGGMVGAWFITPTVGEDGMLKSLSPFALAFLAGYSIELVFAAMDRLIGAFTNGASKEVAAPR